MYYNNNDVRVEEIPKPKINDDEILVKVMASGICGTDVLEWYRIKKAPLVLGHEISGIVAETGNNVKNFQVNDRVFVSHHVPCMKCDYCISNHHTTCETLHETNFYPGGFSQYLRVPKINLEFGTLKLPDNVSFDEGTFIEPLGTIIRAQRIADLQEKQTVLIIGSGIAGLLHIKLAKLKKVKNIITTDINEFRLNKAKEFGANFTLNAKDNNIIDMSEIKKISDHAQKSSIFDKIKENNNGKLADLVIICTGALQAVQQALKCVDKGGKILFFAVPKPDDKVEIPINDFWKNEISILTSYAAAPNDLKESLELIKDKKIDVEDMITHRLPLDEAGKGFKLVADAKESIKVILEPNR